MSDLEKLREQYDEEIRRAREEAWEEGKAAEREFQHRPFGTWYMVENPYRRKTDD